MGSLILTVIGERSSLNVTLEEEMLVTDSRDTARESVQPSALSRVM